MIVGCFVFIREKLFWKRGGVELGGREVRCKYPRLILDMLFFLGGGVMVAIDCNVRR